MSKVAESSRVESSPSTSISAAILQYCSITSNSFILFSLFFFWPVTVNLFTVSTVSAEGR
jgi:hypothetical protein